MQQLGGSTQGCLWMLLLVLQPQHWGFPSRFFLSAPVVPGLEGARPSHGAGHPQMLCGGGRAAVLPLQPPRKRGRGSGQAPGAGSEPGAGLGAGAGSWRLQMSM